MRSGIVVALPLTTVSSQFVIGSFEARFFCAGAFRPRQSLDVSHLQWAEAVQAAAEAVVLLDEIATHSPNRSLGAIRDAHFSQNVLDVLFHCLVADAQ